jgi:aminopeptidase N
MSTPQTIRLADYTPSPYLINRIDLHISLFDDHALVRSRTKVVANPKAEDSSQLRLVGESLQLEAVCIDGVELSSDRYTCVAGELLLTDLPASFDLEIRTRLEPQNNFELSGLYRSGGMFCTQCEAEGFRRITYYLDRPDVMALFTTTIEADLDTCPVLLSNGNLVKKGLLEGGRHFAFWADPFPKPAYLFAMVAGKLAHIEDSFTTQSGRKIKLQIFTEPHNVHKCDFAMASLQRSMKWDEEAYGREYDLDIFMIVAVDDFNMGAMENKGLNIFNSSLVLALPEATTDATFGRIEGVVGHEYFHNWTGNRVTCRDWFQLTLKEGLTVFRDQVFSGDMGSHAVQRIDDVTQLRGRQFPEDTSPMSHPIQPTRYQKIDNFYTATVYEKGAEIIRMMHTLLGAEGYRKGTDLYFKRHDGQAVTTEDFVKALEDASGTKLTQFRRWYRQKGSPRVQVQETWQADEGRYTLEFSQMVPGWGAETKDHGPLHIPVLMGLLDADGSELPTLLDGESTPVVGSRLLELKEDVSRFVFVGLKSKPVPSLLRDFSAPIRLSMDRSVESLAFLLAHDTDSFARYEAGQVLYKGALLDAIACYEKGESPTFDTRIADAARALLADADRDPSYIVRALSMPGFSVLEQEFDTIPVDSILKASRFYREQMALSLKDECTALYQRYDAWLKQKGHALDGENVGRRELKNFCLGLMNEIEGSDAPQLLMQQMKSADNMTDSLTALATMAQRDNAECDEALDFFYDRWKEDPLVMNSWLATQASSRHPKTLARVKALTKHTAFDLHNPNKVRALLGAFSGGPSAFHAEDGSGYAFHAENVLKVDELNAQAASGLVRPLIRLKRFDKKRAAHMRVALEKILACETLSANVREIAESGLK